MFRAKKVRGMGSPNSPSRIFPFTHKRKTPMFPEMRPESVGERIGVASIEWRLRLALLCATVGRKTFGHIPETERLKRALRGRDPYPVVHPAAWLAIFTGAALVEYGFADIIGPYVALAVAGAVPAAALRFVSPLLGTFRARLYLKRYEARRALAPG